MFLRVLAHRRVDCVRMLVLGVGAWCEGVRVRCVCARVSRRVSCRYVRCDGVLTAVCEWGGVGLCVC